MKSRAVVAGIVACLLWSWAILIPAADTAPVRVLFDFAQNADTTAILSTDAAVTSEPGRLLRVRTGHRHEWPGITLAAPGGKWDLTEHASIMLELENRGETPVSIFCRVDNPGADGQTACVTGDLTLASGAAGTLQVILNPTPWRLTQPLELVGMRAAPGTPEKFNAADVIQLLVFVSKPNADRVFAIKKIWAAGHVTTLDSRTFFPFIDELGQFIHADWPGKIHSPAEFEPHRLAEEMDLTAHPRPMDRDQFGGWLKGPTLKATGFFRVEKCQGKWWLVDPEGHLFWSHGIDCVDMGNPTPITAREHYFRDLPATNSALGRFYGAANWAPHGFYQNRGAYKTYDFSRANLFRKYGSDWAGLATGMAHRRLSSWGLNTIANWSDSRTFLLRRTPYTATISANSRILEGSQGYWGKFNDVFDPSFRTALRQRLDKEKGVSAGDPWCLGYFVDNEIAWGDETSLAIATLASPAGQAAKEVFVADLKSKYKTIDRLNAVWGTSHPDWSNLTQSTQAPDAKKAEDDLTTFYSKFAETYFQTIRDELRRVAPHQLYLGCRFAWVNDRAARAAAKYCDVLSYNRYEYSVEKHRPPDGIDLPTIIGEFHFGALDRGLFHTGLKATATQQDRANAYRAYVQGALRNPCIVGTHWFQYQDQATTGRGDGENYQIGFLDVCDTPYPETIQAARDVGYSLYDYRW